MILPVINDSHLDRSVAERLIPLADILIPAEGPWPAPSTTAGICDYFVEAVRVKADQQDLAELATTWTDIGLQDGDAAVDTLQRLLPSNFALFRQICYMGYYAQPEVIRVIQTELNCDYHSPPQPVGYVMELDESIQAPSIGSYTPTSQIRRVDVEAAR